MLRIPRTPPTPETPRSRRVHNDPVLRNYRDGPKQQLINAKPPEHVKVGPFHVSHVNDYVLANTVARDNIPVILYDARIDVNTYVEEQAYAVLAPPNKNIRMVCAGCYFPGMSLFHTYDGVMGPRTFYGHFETAGKDGPRKRPCRLHPDYVEPLELKKNRMADIPPEPESPSRILCQFSESDLLEELNRRPAGLSVFLPHISIDDLLKEIESRPNTRLHPSGDTAIAQRAVELFPALARPPDLETQALIEELERRCPIDLARLLPRIPQADVIAHAVSIDPSLTDRSENSCVGSTFEELEAEIRRVCHPDMPSEKSFYNRNPKRKRKGPHFTDPPVISYDQVHRLIADRCWPDPKSQHNDSMYARMP